MSIIEDERRALDPRLLRWLGFGLAVVGAGVGIAVAFVHDRLLTTAALVLPLVVLGLATYAPAAFETLRRRSINGIIALPAMMLAVVAIMTQPMSYDLAVEAAAACGVGGLAMGLWARQQPGLANPNVLLLFFPVVAAAYGFGATVVADVRYDASKGDVYRAQVLQAYETRGRSTTYHLVLAPWGPVTKTFNASVTWQAYKALGVGATACVVLHPGVLGTPWYQVGVCDAG